MEEEITRLFKIRRTVMQMLRDRGYIIEESDLLMKRDEFVQKFCETPNKVTKESLFFEASKGPNSPDKIYVFYPEGLKVGAKVIREIATKMKIDNVRRGIVVVPMPLGGIAKRGVLECNKAITIEVFEEAELVTNITDHKLINKYYVLDDKAKKELLEKYTVKDTQLPRILVSDPIARYYGLKRGQVVKIRRSDATSLDYYTYRFAV